MSRMKSQHAAMLSRGRLGRSAGVEEMAGQVLRVAFADARVRAYDTGRFARAIGLMNNQLRTRPVAVPAIRPSEHREEQRRTLEKQEDRLVRAEERLRKEVKRWEHIAGNPDKRSGDGAKKLARLLRKKLDRAVKARQRAEAQVQDLEDHPSAILIGGRKTKRSFALSSLKQLRTKVYGGAATVREVGGRMTVVELRNLEPHARIVEKRTGIMRAALAAGFRGTGLRFQSKKHIDAVARGLAPRRRATGRAA